MKPQAFVFIGRYGAGKGTQASQLIEALKKKYPDREPLYVETGKEFRNFIQGPTYTATLSKGVIESGDLMPEFMPILMWATRLVGNFTGKEDLVFDGTPRKLIEAKIFDSVFPFYKLNKPWIIYLDVHHEESHNRLKIRAQTSGRVDDGSAQIEERKRAYEADVVPVIEYFRTSDKVNFLDIDGVRTIEEIHADIVKRLGLE